MAKYHNKKATKLIGQNIRSLREKIGLEIEDIAAMTGFHRNVIQSIENGANTDLSHLIEIAFALNKSPKELLELPFNIKPRFQLSPTRKEKNRLTFRITALIKEEFFKKSKTSREVCDELTKRYPESVNIATKNISVILNRQVKQKKLKVKKSGRRNIYQISKNS